MDEIVGTAGPVPDVIDALGTLSISDHGISRFFGPTGGSEVRSIVSHPIRETNTITEPIDCKLLKLANLPCTLTRS
jgi:hypothetical protein